MKGATVAEATADSADPDVDADSKGATTSEAKTDAEVEDSETTTSPAAHPRQLILGLRTVVIGAVLAVLVLALGGMTWLYFGERSTVQAHIQKTENYQRAEQIALDYAMGAATMNFQDLNTWKDWLRDGTSPDLQEKLTKAADSMQQLLIPLEWNSTSEPLAAKVRSEDAGVYVVDTFVSVLTKTTQAPDNLQSTATYSVTIDSNNDWLITDVGGVGAVAGAN